MLVVKERDHAQKLAKLAAEKLKSGVSMKKLDKGAGGPSVSPFAQFEVEECREGIEGSEKEFLSIQVFPTFL
jgi:hypothetical protein